MRKRQCRQWKKKTNCSNQNITPWLQELEVKWNWVFQKFISNMFLFQKKIIPSPNKCFNAEMSSATLLYQMNIVHAISWKVRSWTVSRFWMDIFKKKNVKNLRLKSHVFCVNILYSHCTITYYCSCNSVNMFMQHNEHVHATQWTCSCNTMNMFVQHNEHVHDFSLFIFLHRLGGKVHASLCLEQFHSLGGNLSYMSRNCMKMFFYLGTFV
jgi:hypothetical protein